MTIAGSRLDIQMGLLWRHLDTAADWEACRRAPGAKQTEQVRRLAEERLTGQLRNEVLAAADDAEAARLRRNEIVHQDWVLRGTDAMRSVAEIAEVPPEDMPAYLEEWERESKLSPNWQKVPRDSLAVVPAQTLDELRRIERALAAATDVVNWLTFKVASSRETGKPPGYLHPS